MAKIIGVKFKQYGKLYYFAPGNGEFAEGQGVIVETARGAEYATVCMPCKEVPDEELVAPLKPVLRAATERDLENMRRNEERRAPAMKTAAEKIAARGLDMKLVDCEFAFDGSKVVFYFTADGRVDFRELVKDLSSVFHMRIELRQIGVRDEAKLLGGFGPCGRECCCSVCMPDFQKVSIKMAKNQGLSLNPGKISGLCGRLMCCLAYENDYYAEACKKMPKVGSEVGTPEGTGTVVNANMLKMEAKVRIDKGDGAAYKDFPVEQLRFKRKGEKREEREEAGEES
ncbi:MAG TPA: stage 0 sporulation family protein [Candidatus Coproplasma avistercoris]|nr:stage 0 sporulation family protein [Candidatus Coproplasma avistercoris]